MANLTSLPTHPNFQSGTVPSSERSRQNSGEDLCAPTKRHPLQGNPWAVENEPEFGSVKLERIAIIERNSAAIAAIAQLLANSSNSSDATGSEPFDSWTVTCLIGGIESICSLTMIQTEEMRFEAGTLNR